MEAGSSLYKSSACVTKVAVRESLSIDLRTNRLSK